jgi:hypothetical protein
MLTPQPAVLKHDCTTESIRKGWSAVTIEDFEKVQGNKLLAIKFGGTYHSNPQPTIESLRHLFRLSAKEQGATLGTFDMAPVLPAQNSATDGTAFPYTYMVYNIIGNDWTVLTGCRVLAAGGKAFILVPFDPNPTSFICALTGYKYGANEAHKVQEVVTRKLWESATTIFSFITNNHDLISGAIEDAVVSMLNAVHIEEVSLHNPERPGFNLHIDTPTKHAHREWCDLITSLSLYNSLSGMGVPIERAGRVKGVDNRRLICFGCKSLRHVVEDCPFFDLPGWDGPKKTDVMAAHRALPKIRVRDGDKGNRHQGAKQGRYILYSGKRHM